MTRTEIAAARALCGAAFGDEWAAPVNKYDRSVYVKNEADEYGAKICDLRGWGYLTGVGGLNLPPEHAAAIQDANREFIAHARKGWPAALDALEAALERIKVLEACLSYDRPGSGS